MPDSVLDFGVAQQNLNSAETGRSPDYLHDRALDCRRPNVRSGPTLVGLLPSRSPKAFLDQKADLSDQLTRL